MDHRIPGGRRGIELNTRFGELQARRTISHDQRERQVFGGGAGAVRSQRERNVGRIDSRRDVRQIEIQCDRSMAEGSDCPGGRRDADPTTLRLIGASGTGAERRLNRLQRRREDEGQSAGVAAGCMTGLLAHVLSDALRHVNDVLVHILREASFLKHVGTGVAVRRRRRRRTRHNGRKDVLGSGGRKNERAICRETEGEYPGNCFSGSIKANLGAGQRIVDGCL